MKVKASILLYTIVLALFIALISSSLILLAYYYKLQFEQLTGIQEVQRACDSGLAYLLGQSGEKSLEEGNTSILIGTEADRDLVVDLQHKQWGVYELGISSSTKGNYTCTKIAQMGYGLDSTQSFALYLPERANVLSLAGNTVIHGDVFLPKKGTKRAYIEGQTFTGQIRGKRLQNSYPFPHLDSTFIAQNSRFFQNDFAWTDSLAQDKAIPKGFFHSFEEKTLLIHQAQSMYLSDIEVRGNVVFVSAEAIYVGADAYLENVLVYAPFVQIEAGFSGNAQFFAKDTLLVGENVLLNFPSALAVLADKEQKRALLKIEKDTRIEGVVVLQTESGSLKNRSLLSIQKDAVVEGQVFSNRRLELKGRVNGSVACSKFYLKTTTSIYENHLLNATIDIHQRSDFFVGTDIFGKTAKRKLVKWLD